VALKVRRLLLIAVAAACLGIQGAHAGTFALYSTGVNNDGSLLGLGVADEHYTITAVPSGVTSNAAYTLSKQRDVWLAGPSGDITYWNADGNRVPTPTPTDPNSHWLSLSSDGTIRHAPGDYWYEQTFMLPSTFSPGTGIVTFSGRWATDNTGTIWVNGQQVTPDTGNWVGSTIGSPGYKEWAEFTITGSLGFKGGENVLRFVVTNTTDIESPTGLRVEIYGNSGNYTPEPGSMALIGCGLALAAIRRRRRKE